MEGNLTHRIIRRGPRFNKSRKNYLLNKRVSKSNKQLNKAI